MSSYVGPAPGSFRLPSVPDRVLGVALRAIPFAIFYLGWPYLGQLLTSRLGVPFPFPLASVLLFGVGLLALSLVRYLAKPTRLYGPVSLAYALAILGYLFWLSAHSTVEILYRSASISITFSELVLVLTAIPLLMMAGALLTTIEDGVRPGERYPFDFPA